MEQNKLLSAPGLMIVGTLAIAGMVGLLQTGIIGVRKPYSEAQKVVIPQLRVVATDAKYDINGDRYIDNMDTVMISNAIRSKKYIAKADIASSQTGEGADGRITVEDLTLFRNYILREQSLGTEAVRFKLYFDLNMDNVINNKDVKIVADAVTAAKSPAGAYNPMADIASSQTGEGADGRITVEDLTLFRNYILREQSLGTEAVRFKLYFDLNMDNVINNKDVKIVADAIANNKYDSMADVDFTTGNCENFEGLAKDACLAMQLTNQIFHKITIKDLTVITTFVYDLNNDGLAEKADQTLLSNVILGTVKCPTEKNCDFNGDGKVNIADGVTMTNAILAIKQSLTF